MSKAGQVSFIEYMQKENDNNLIFCRNYLERVKDKTVSLSIMRDVLLYANDWTRWPIYCEIMNNKKVTRAAAIYGYRMALCLGRADYRAISIYDEQGFTIEEMLKGKKERKLWESLPDKVTLYRGCSTKEAEFGNFGFSWTLNRRIAEFFAFRNYKMDTAVYSILIDKKDIKAIILERDEDEALFFDSLFVMDNYRMVTDKPTEYYEDYMKAREKKNKRIQKHLFNK